MKFKEDKQAMKKSDLKQGALVQTRAGANNVYILIGKEFVNLKDGGYIPLEEYNEDLLTGYSDYADTDDVMKVFNPPFEYQGYYTYINGGPFEWTWERKEEEPSKELTKELTVGEIEKLLGYKVKIVRENE